MSITHVTPREMELQAEVTRLEARLTRWKEARQSAIDAGELMRAELTALRAKLEAIEKQEPVEFQLLILGKRWTHCTEQLYRLSTDRTTVRALYLAAGAKQESATPDAWDALGSVQMKLCPTCGNKRCPKANDPALDCTGSNEVGQPGSGWEHVKPFGAKEKP